MGHLFRLAVLGSPVGHSLSPRIQEEALRLAGLDGEYLAIEADIAVLESALEDLRSGRLDGFNVTMPLKLAAEERCDRLTTDARASRSVNTVRFRRGRVEGHSTDVVAFRELRGGYADAARVLVLGTGGSARAALVAWSEGDALVSARDPGKAVDLAAEMGAGVGAWGEPVPEVVVVNATPIGMRGEALPPGLIEASSGLIDLPYGAGTTPAVARARELGVPVVDGIEFLARQAAAAFQWWTGVVVDSDRLAAVARNG